MHSLSEHIIHVSVAVCVSAPTSVFLVIVNDNNDMGVIEVENSQTAGNVVKLQGLSHLPLGEKSLPVLVEICVLCSL